MSDPLGRLGESHCYPLRGPIGHLATSKKDVRRASTSETGLLLVPVVQFNECIHPEQQIVMMTAIEPTAVIGLQLRSQLPAVYSCMGWLLGAPHHGLKQLVFAVPRGAVTRLESVIARPLFKWAVVVASKVAQWPRDALTWSMGWACRLQNSQVSSNQACGFRNFLLGPIPELFSVTCFAAFPGTPKN